MVDAPFPPTSPRPTLFVDQQGRPVVDPKLDRLGRPGPIGRPRLLKALPLADGPRLMRKPAALIDQHGRWLADPDGAVLARPAVWVHRMLTAEPAPSTRRL